MANWHEGDHVRVRTREVTEEDRKLNRYFEHMAGLTGTVQSVYEDKQVAVQVDVTSLSPITASVHKTATQRLRDKFVGSVSEEQRKALTKEELEFDTNYVVLVQASDLEKP